jgi:hypothetical protein
MIKYIILNPIIMSVSGAYLENFSVGGWSVILLLRIQNAFISQNKNVGNNQLYSTRWIDNGLHNKS